MFRKKQLPPELAEAEAGFQAVLEQLEPAKEAITDVLPGTRMPGRPLHDALAAFEGGLERAAALMPAWRRPQTQEVWSRCETGLASALALTHRAREEAPDVIGFEGLLGLVEELLDPLEPFEAAEERFRALRR
ncbi:MAG: hypothetical protein ACM3OO_09475 [Planctomycetaceae bacterium]